MGTFKPSAIVSYDAVGNATVYAVHTDQVNMPQKLTDASGAIVYDRPYTPFGETVSTTGSLLVILQFPGQREDNESNLFQNWHRDFDPSLGRYVQSDPIGLAGGINTYGYVGGNPLIAVDPTGLDCELSGTCPPGSGFSGHEIINYCLQNTCSPWEQEQVDNACGDTCKPINELTPEDWAAGKQAITENATIISSFLSAGPVGQCSVRAFLFAKYGREISFGKNLRVAPFGNRTGHKFGKYPHYHRGRPDPKNPGHNLRDQGHNRHRPWEPRTSDKKFWDRF